MNQFDVFVLCGGKCGGSTLANTFQKNNYKTTHVHSINCKGAFYSDINLDMGLFNIIDYSCQNKKIIIVDSYRTPIERKMSAFFQHIEQLLPNYKTLQMETIASFFNDNILKKEEEYHSINIALNHYGIPLFEKFDFVNKYNIIENNNKVFIKLLFNNIDEWEDILSNILGTKIKLHPQNLTTNKAIYDIYKKFKNNYKLPSDYNIYSILNDREFKIYNTPEQQEEYINKWNLKTL